MGSLTTVRARSPDGTILHQPDMACRLSSLDPPLLNSFPFQVPSIQTGSNWVRGCGPSFTLPQSRADGRTPTRKTNAEETPRKLRILETLHLCSVFYFAHPPRWYGQIGRVPETWPASGHTSSTLVDRAVIGIFGRHFGPERADLEIPLSLNMHSGAPQSNLGDCA